MTATDPLATADLQERAHRHLLMHFTRNGAFGPEGKPLLVLERGEGPYVFDTDGKRYFDGLSSLFCAQIGYSFGEEMAAAAAQQLTTLAFNTNWATAHPPAIELAEAIAERAPGDLNRVFFTNGGSESVEAAWKIVRQYYLAKGEPQRTKAIAREIAYHGVTLGALSFTGVRPMKEPFGAAPIPVVRVSNTNPFRADRRRTTRRRCARLLDEMEHAIVETGPETVAMIIAEPVQNAGGCLVPPDGYWAGLRELADRYGIALVADEVITGFGRIGEWFAAARVRRDAGPDHVRQGHHLRVRADGRRDRVRPDRRAALRGRPDAAARHHLRRPPGRGRDRAAQHRDLRARGRARERARARGLPRRPPARAAGARADRRRRARRRLLLGARARARRGRHPLQRRGARAAAARVPDRPAARGGPDRPRRTTAATPCCTSPRR